MSDQDLPGQQKLANDSASRAAAIVSFDLLFPVEDVHLDTICRFVAAQCDAPIALVSLVDEAEQRFLGKTGTVLPGTARSTSFCAIAMNGTDIMVVPDATMDPRFADYAIVLGEPHVRFYAGAPLVTDEGVPLGALCVLDTRPREEGLSETQKATLRLMADAVMDRLSLRRARRDEQMAAKDSAMALDASEWRFRTLADTMPQMVWSSRADGYSDYFNARWYAFTGLPEGSSKGSNWRLSLHPDDHERTSMAWQESVHTGAPYEIEYRLKRFDGQYRWALTRGLPMRADNGRITRWFGTCTDIHDHKIALEERELVSQELAHRIKNIFAVISGLIGLSARASPTVQPFADALRDRVLALGRAHDFVQPQGQDARSTMRKDSLQGLLREIFAPYEHGDSQRIVIMGDDVQIDDRSATPLALTFHEVVTNAAKYGALSGSEGHVVLSIHADRSHIDMHWQERGGPVVQRGNAGFGSRLLELSVRRQLGGSFDQDWNPAGLDMRLRIPLTAFSRPSA
ncbi:MAG TPA: PAS domain-containing protein [Sphingobium sp.]|uniref:sensor histidine kinase n=1 Tax=Sphingobium sp. TaxID=1912891 RepID=UPI002ED211F7